MEVVDKTIKYGNIPLNERLKYEEQAKYLIRHNYVHQDTCVIKLTEKLYERKDYENYKNNSSREDSCIRFEH